MKLKPKQLPYISLVFGLTALAARFWLLRTGVDQRGLLNGSHPANALVYILVAAALLLLLCAAVSQGALPTGVFPKVGSFVGAVGILLTSLPGFVSVGRPLALISSVLGIAAAVELFYQPKKKQAAHISQAVLTVYFMLHILSQYQAWNTEPQLQLYLPQLFASVFLMVSAYYRYAQGTAAGNRKALLFFHYGAAFLCLCSIVGDAPVFYLAMALWTLSQGWSDQPAAMVLPAQAQLCIDTLEKNGHAAYVVGGCVRDHLLGLAPHDYDLCTDATPEQICQLFQDYPLVRSGEKHGTIGVVIDGQNYEITTFRTEGEYSDNRHPDRVSFVSTIEEDLSRRDFTVNAIAYSPTRGYADPFGGRQDLKNKILRAVGNPQARFREDALRILRGVRFAVRFRLTPEEKTLDAMKQCAPLMDNLAKERIFTELCGILPLVTAQDLLTYQFAFVQVIPELSASVGFQQNNPHHLHDVYTHSAYAVEGVPPQTAIRLAALLHDIGKPGAYTVDQAGVGHFYGHAQESTAMADRVLRDLKAPTALRDEVLFLVENHMTLLEPDKKLLRRRLSKHGFENTCKLMTLQKADLIATGTAAPAELAAYDILEELLRQIREEDSCLGFKDLAVNGSDLISLGFAPGPVVGQCLKHLLTLVLDEQLPNERTALLQAAKEYQTEAQGGTL